MPKQPFPGPVHSSPNSHPQPTFQLSRKFQQHLVAALEMNDEDTSMESRTELDSHADSPVIGRNAKIISYNGQSASVTGFTKDLGKCLSVPIVSAAIAYTDEDSGETVVLLVHNALYIKSMEHNLIPPFMIRLAGIHVDECPKFLSPNPTLNTHAITWFDKDNTTVNLRINLQLQGIISYFPTRIPHEDELDNCNRFNLTPDSPEWDPHSERYSNQEYSMLNFRGEIDATRARRPNRELFVGQVKINPNSPTCDVVPNVQVSAVMTEISPTLCQGHFAQSMNKLSGEKNITIEVSAMYSGKRSAVNANELAKLWNISSDLAKRTIESTTQRSIRIGGKNGLVRRYQSNDRMLRYNRVNCNVFMDTFFATQQKGFKSTRGNTCAQLFVTDFNHVVIKPIKSRSEGIHRAVKSYFKNYGVPNALVADPAREQILGETKKFCQQCDTDINQLEKGTPWANRAELYIGIMKQKILRLMKKSRCPARLWDYCAEYCYKINNSIAHDHYQLGGMVPNTKLTGQPHDISDLNEFQWYDWCYYWDIGADFPMPKEALGRVLGPSENAGTEMSQWVMNAKGEVLPRHTLRKLTPQEMNSETEKKLMADFDSKIEQKFGPPAELPELRSDPDKPEPFDDDTEPQYEDGDGQGFSMPEADDFPDYDGYLHTEVTLPHGEHMQCAKVIKRVVDETGNVVGSYNQNPILDTRVYEVLFPDGATKQYAANVIAENLFAECDDEGYCYQGLKRIVDHRSDGTALTKDQAFVTGKNGNQHRKETTKGWYLLVEWTDGTTSWKPLRDMKESVPVQTADYAKACGIDDEPAFAWWVPFTLKKRNQIIAAVNHRVKKTTHKYGIRVPDGFAEAYDLDVANQDNYWRNAISKEMKNSAMAFQIKERGEKPPPGYTRTTYHMVFDVKMDFTRKARLVLDGHKTPPPKNSSTYSGVVSRESVRIAFTYAALNDLDVCAADIQNAYLQAPNSEKYYIECGPEFGSENVGKIALVVRALYGGPASGANFRNHLRDCMNLLGYQSCLADPDVWMRKAKKKKDGTPYWEYVLLYVDDMLCISEEAKGGCEEIGKYFTLKPGSAGPPDIYLGGKVSMVTMPNGVTCHAYSSSQYVQNAVKNVEQYLSKKGLQLKQRASSPLMRDYRPELDISPELSPEDASYYHSLIGILRWAVELGRIDICTEVSMMSSHLALPREGHLQQVFHIFAYLKCKHNSRIAFDPTYPEIDYEKFKRRNWKDFYEGAKEEIPLNAPTPLGKPMIIRAFVDADHAGNKLTRRSRTGFIVYINMAPVYWLSKKQTSIETSSFGSEFTAMKHCCEYLAGLRYKLRMMGIPMEDPVYIYGDNQSVLANTTVPESMLKKKSNSIAYHYVREGCAADMWRTSYINTEWNPADLLSKPIPAGVKRDKKVGFVMYDL